MYIYIYIYNTCVLYNIVYAANNLNIYIYIYMCEYIVFL